ncbi:hypothetical protein [Amycolatopsis sp. lyj-346]|uniref:hypothetical protein n=1 Tax=Amycolatopsis sp. lyj-346 TaxID=2789289 RepID=UPI00397C81F2
MGQGGQDAQSGPQQCPELLAASPFVGVLIEVVAAAVPLQLMTFADIVFPQSFNP